MADAKTYLTLTRYNLQGAQPQQLGPSFSAMINPSEFSLSQAILYNKTAALGSSAPNLRFVNVRGDKVSFSLVLDGTGVVPVASAADAGKTVAQRLEELSAVVYDYDGEKHQPDGVKLLWGSFVFYGYLDSMDTQYTLFMPSGEPLRARVSLSFTGSKSSQEESLQAKRASPDLSHSVLVRSGDTLPLLCERIYGDGRYYLAVARFNGLASFRRLQPGLRLHFPPLSS